MTNVDTWNRLLDLGIVKGEMPAKRWNLSSVNLSRANLSGADLSEAYLFMADLSKANLSGVNLKGADVSQSELVDTTLDTSSLMGANFSGADLRGANLNRADLSDANFAGANLGNTKVQDAYLIKTNLEGANLRGVNLRYSDLTRANLSNAILIGADLYNALLTKCLLRNSKIINVNFNLANLSGADITGATFWGVSTTGWIIDGINAKYLYFTNKDREQDKENYKRVFAEGQFEKLYQCLPTIELIFDGGINPTDLLTLMAIVEDINNQHKELGLKMTGMSVKGVQTLIEIQTIRNDLINTAALLIKKGINDAIEGIFTDKKLLPYLNPNNSPYQITSKNPNITFDIEKLEINIKNTDGSYHLHGPNLGSFGNLTDATFTYYLRNKREIDKLFNSLKESISGISLSIRKEIIESIDSLTAILNENEV